MSSINTDKIPNGLNDFLYKESIAKIIANVSMVKELGINQYQSGSRDKSLLFTTSVRNIFIFSSCRISRTKCTI